MTLFRPIAVLAVLLACLTALAQQNRNPPQLPPEFLDRARQLEGDSLRVCVSQASVLVDFERDLARAIGDVLLLDIEVREIAPFRAPPILDYRFAANPTELFTLLHNECQIMLGFLLVSGEFGDWLTITRPYLTMGFVVATTDPDARSLADLSPGARIGSRMLSTADIRFLDFNLSRPEAQQWRRIPYPNNRLIIDRLVDGELDAILIWEAGLLAAFDGDPENAGVRRIDATPFRTPEQQFGAVMLSRETYLRTVLDEALEILVAEGVVYDLLETHGLPGQGSR